MNTGDTAFVLVSPALVMLTIPWMALFYGEMVRRENGLGTIGWGFWMRAEPGNLKELKQGISL